MCCIDGKKVLSEGYSWIKGIFKEPVAFGTLLLAIATFLLVRTTSNQVNLSSLETRPFVHTKLAQNNETTKTNLFIPLNMTNDGHVPAQIVFYKANLNISDYYGNKILSKEVVNTRLLSPTSIYPGALSPISFDFQGQSLSPEFLKQYKTNKIAFRIDVCIIYKSVTDDDKRQWQVNEDWLIQQDGVALFSSSDKSVSNGYSQCEPSLTPTPK